MFKIKKIDYCPLHGNVIHISFPHKNNKNNYNCQECMRDKLNLRMKNDSNRLMEIIRVCKKHGATNYKWEICNSKTGKGQYYCIKCRKENRIKNYQKRKKQLIKC